MEEGALFSPGYLNFIFHFLSLIMTKRIAAQQARAAVATQSRGLYTSYPQHPSNIACCFPNLHQAPPESPPHIPRPVKLNFSTGQPQTPSGLPVVEKRPHKLTSLEKTSISRLKIFCLKVILTYRESLVMEKQVEDRILRKQLAIADASFRVRQCKGSKDFGVE